MACVGLLGVTQVKPFRSRPRRCVRLRLLNLPCRTYVWLASRRIADSPFCRTRYVTCVRNCYCCCYCDTIGQEDWNKKFSNNYY